MKELRNNYKLMGKESYFLIFAMFLRSLGNAPVALFFSMFINESIKDITLYNIGVLFSLVSIIVLGPLVIFLLYFKNNMKKVVKGIKKLKL